MKNFILGDAVWIERGIPLPNYGLRQGLRQEATSAYASVPEQRLVSALRSALPRLTFVIMQIMSYELSSSSPAPLCQNTEVAARSVADAQIRLVRHGCRFPTKSRATKPIPATLQRLTLPHRHPCPAGPPYRPAPSHAWPPAPAEATDPRASGRIPPGAVPRGKRCG